MAKKRMFNNEVLDTDAFLEMPLSAQALYFHLNLRADDDGFISNPRRVQTYVGASEDDLKLLIMKRFVITFDDGVIVIKHWRMHNTIQKDRYKVTNYIEDLNMLRIKDNGSYTTDENGYLIGDLKKGKTEYSESRLKRIQAKKDSNLPSFFDNVIRNAFEGKECPICGVEMHREFSQIKPTIQHNIPISKGGKHEIDNISVICQSCNCSVQNRVETIPYNTDEVKRVWECIGNVSTDIDIDIDIDIDKEKEIYKEKESRFENKELDEAFNEFVTMRKKIKKPMTQNAIKRAITKLNNLSNGDDELAILILNQSVDHCWQDLYEYKGTYIKKIEKQNEVVDKTIDYGWGDD